MSVWLRVITYLDNIFLFLLWIPVLFSPLDAVELYVPNQNRQVY